MCQVFIKEQLYIFIILDRLKITSCEETLNRDL